MKSITLPNLERVNKLGRTVNIYVRNDAVTALVIEALGQHADMTHTGRELAIIVKDALWSAVSHGEMEQATLPDALSCTYLWLGEFILNNDVLEDAAEELRVWEKYFSK